MALTLAEAAKLSNDVLLVGVIETIIQESPVLQVKGNQRRLFSARSCSAMDAPVNRLTSR